MAQINLNEFRDGNGNLTLPEKLFNDIVNSNNGIDTKVGNIEAVTGRFSGVATTTYTANAGAQSPGIVISKSGASAQNVYLVTCLIQTSAGNWVSVTSQIVLYYNGSEFAQFGSIAEITRTVPSVDPTNGATIGFSSSSQRFRIEVPNLSVSYNALFSYTKII